MSGFAGFLLGAALIIQYQGNNNCIWKVSYGLNIPVSLILAYAPKYIGKLPVFLLIDHLSGRVYVEFEAKGKQFQTDQVTK